MSQLIIVPSTIGFLSRITAISFPKPKPPPQPIIISAVARLFFAGFAPNRDSATISANVPIPSVDFVTDGPTGPHGVIANSTNVNFFFNGQIEDGSFANIMANLNIVISVKNTFGGTGAFTIDINATATKGGIVVGSGSASVHGGFGSAFPVNSGSHDFILTVAYPSAACTANG